MHVRPAAFDLATCWYPESHDLNNPGLKLRPGLILGVLESKKTGKLKCRVSYGTTNLKIVQRNNVDLIIQNVQDITQFGLGRATRFDLDFILDLPRNEEFFGCWSGYKSPIISKLTEDYIKNYAFFMMRRGSV